MNKITVNFTTCTPPPANGYKIYYRVTGSDGSYILGGTFYTSPAIFYDTVNPAGTCYEGYIVSACGDVMGNHIPFETCGSIAADNSSCGTTISTDTASLTYEDLGYTDLHVDGVTTVTILWDTHDRPNKFTVYEDGAPLISTGWKGYAPYPGPWGTGTLSTAETGSLVFNPIPGKEYKIRIEVGPAGDAPYNITDNFTLQIHCS